jgi:hypothetical protein
MNSHQIPPKIEEVDHTYGQGGDRPQHHFDPKFFGIVRVLGSGVMRRSDFSFPLPSLEGFGL